MSILTLNQKEDPMKVPKSVTNFMDYQKINSGKKYGQELWPVS